MLLTCFKRLEEPENAKQRGQEMMEFVEHHLSGIRLVSPTTSRVTWFAGQRENMVTYSTLAFVVGGVVLASGVEPDLHFFGALVCFLGTAFRGLRAVLQAILLRPEENLDSISCLAYMAPVSTLLMFLLCGILEPGGYRVLLALPWAGRAMLVVLTANCLAAFLSNYLNMVVTRRTSALSIQVCVCLPSGLHAALIAHQAGMLQI
jgi:1,4-dihydroxy-2-naphthoate octaprenyltransferase